MNISLKIGPRFVRQDKDGLGIHFETFYMRKYTELYIYTGVYEY